jgi:hypothetical protein
VLGGCWGVMTAFWVVSEGGGASGVHLSSRRCILTNVWARMRITPCSGL